MKNSNAVNRAKLFFYSKSKQDLDLVRALFTLNLFIFSVLFESVLGIPKLIKYLLSVYAIGVIIIYYFRGKVRVREGIFQELVILLFTIVSIYLLINSVRFETFYLQELFAEQFYFLPYLTPVLLLRMSFRLNFYQLLLKWTYRLLPLAIIVQFFVITTALSVEDYPFNIVGILTVSMSPLLLLGLYSYHQARYSLNMLLIYFLLFAFVTASMGRRGETLEVLFIFGWAYWIRLRSTSISLNKKQNILALGFVLLLGGIFFIAETKDDIYLFERGLTQEGFDESRGETVDMFLLDFGSRPSDWSLGRGLNGKVQKFDRGEEGKSRSIEIGYFNALLKGGLAYLIPMLIILFSAFYKGYYKSNNDLAKLLSGLALWQIIYMVSFGLPNFNFSYTFLWIGVSSVLNRDFRALTNEDLTQTIKF
ncbi:MAG TPA: hypothetical protein DCR48_09090 [Flavobacteriales bacterium]|nr:hypothetical protein [Flavobacteriales bacterium]